MNDSSEENSQGLSNNVNSQNISIEQILQCNEKLAQLMTSAMEVTINNLGNRMNQHVNNLTEAVHSLASSSSNKLGEDHVQQQSPESADNSDSGQGRSGQVDPRPDNDDDTISLHAGDRSLYQESRDVTARAFLENEEVTDDDPLCSAIKGFSGSYNVPEEKFGDVVSDDVQSAVMIAYKEALSEEHLKSLYEDITLPENCKVAQTKLVNSVIFSTVTPAIRSTDIKLQEMQRDFSKVTACLIKLLVQLPEVFRSKSNDIERKTEVIQVVLDGLKLTGHGSQAINKLRKKYLLYGLSPEYKDLPKFAPDTDSHLFGEELEDSLKKARAQYYNLLALKKQNRASSSFSSPSHGQKRKADDHQKSKNARPAKKPWVGQKGSPHSQSKQQGRQDSRPRKDQRGHRN